VIGTNSFVARGVRRASDILRSSEVEILLVFAFSFVLRIVNLGSFPRWYVDEGSMAEQGINMFHLHYGYSTWGPNFFPPFFVMIDGLFLTLFGPSYPVARFPAALMGAISCVITFLIAQKLSGRKVAIVAAAILAISGAYINRMALQDNATELFFLLTLLLYLNLKDDPKNTSKLALGLASGLAILSKYTGIVAPLFLLIEGGIDKRLGKMKLTFMVTLLCILVYPLLGFVLDWNGFLYDTLYQATRQFSAGTVLYVISLGGPFYQLQYWQSGLGLTSFSFTTIGLLSTIYMISKERMQRSHVVASAFLSLLVVLTAAAQVWWASLILLYPVYAIATSYFLFRFGASATLIRKSLATGVRPVWRTVLSDPGLVSIVLSACLLAAGLYGIVAPPQYAGGRIELALLAVATLFIVSAYRVGYRRVLRTCVIVLMVAMLIAAGTQTSLQFVTNENRDQLAVVQYLNTRTVPTDMVAASPAITWLLKCVGVNYAEVAFYTTHSYTYLYGIELLPRFKMNITLWNFRYIVLDTPWLRDKLGGSLSVQELTPIILSNWRNVANIGDYRVYENPHGEAKSVLFTLQGYIFAPGGTSPVPKCWVSLYDAAFDVSYGSWTDERGYYNFTTNSGTFVFDVWPPPTSYYAHYQETNFIVSGSITKNVTLTSKT
jgi:4-amino-4-deoxy-L-arabinose transferase-like glycosyltransferase